MRLLFKVTRLFLIVLIPILSLFIYLELKDEKRVLSSFLEKEGNLLASTISAGSIESILIEDYPFVESYLVQLIENYNSIVFIKITRDDEVITFAQNAQLLNDKLKLFYYDIKIEDDVIGKIKLAMSTEYIDSVIKKRTNSFLLMVILGSLIIFVLLIYIVRNNLINHIERLKEHAKLIGEGVYNKEIVLKTSDEFEDLAESINTMSSNINNAYKRSKKLTTELKQQKIDLIDANKAKDIFLANMSHELKTPLNSINIISAVMKKNKDNSLNENQIKNLNIINKCGQELLFLINDVLDISKLNAGEVKVNYETFNLKELTQDIKLLFEPQINNKELTLEFSFDENISFIYSDAQKIKQIIKNFLSNAVKFVKKGKIEFKVVNKNEYVHIIIKDNGIGIEEKKLVHIFDRFKQVDDSTSRKYGGTGLGLAISKELAHLLNGEIFVSSKLDVGSTFTLELPKNLKKIHEKKEEELENKENIKEKTKILFFTKNLSEGMKLVINLKKSFDVTQVFSMKELDIKIRRNFDTNIIDIENISDLDIKQLKQLPENIKSNTFLLTKDSDNISLDLKASVKKVIAKPIKTKELTHSILNYE